MTRHMSKYSTKSATLSAHCPAAAKNGEVSGVIASWTSTVYATPGRVQASGAGPILTQTIAADAPQNLALSGHQSCSAVLSTQFRK